MLKRFEKLDSKSKQLKNIVAKKLGKIELNCSLKKNSLDHFVNGYISPIITEISGLSLKLLYGIETNVDEETIKLLEIRLNNKINLLFEAHKLKDNNDFLDLIKDSFEENPSQIKTGFQDAINHSRK